MSNIRFLKRKQIDEEKWNSLIADAGNSLPYAFSWYLDAVAENWDAFVLDDFKAVMPLVWLRKVGIKCLYQPYYCQQLGVFNKTALRQEELREFITGARDTFNYININLNPSVQTLATEFKFNKKKNLLLDLNFAYNALQKKYSENHRRNIAKANKAGLTFSEETSLKSFQAFYLENVNRTKENFKKNHEKNFRAITHELISNKKGEIFASVGADGKLLAAVMLIIHAGRNINIINTSSTAGKSKGASHFLFDQMIQKLSGTATVLDFEGSSIPSIARFYEGFGAYEQPFYNYTTTIIANLKQRFL